MSNAIPPLHPDWVGSWDQPDPKSMTITGEFAFMHLDTFLMLHNYACTNPSGCYEGKMWRRDEHERTCGMSHEHLLCWFDTSPRDPDCCVVHTRKIRFCEPEFPGMAAELGEKINHLEMAAPPLEGGDVMR